MVCACVGQPPDPLGPDAGGDADADVDDPTDARLAFEFGTDPAVPGPFPGPGAPSVREIRFTLRDVRAIGDAATGSDTRIDSFDLRWQGGDSPGFELDAAPPGMYSSLLARVVEFEISGTVTIDGAVESFEIEDDEVVDTLGIPLSIQLAPDESRVVTVTFSGDGLFDGIDWASLPIEDGKRVLESDDTIRYRALAAFSADAGDDVGN